MNKLTLLSKEHFDEEQSEGQRHDGNTCPPWQELVQETQVFVHPTWKQD